mgnify:CR=1 FL=1
MVFAMAACGGNAGTHMTMGTGGTAGTYYGYGGVLGQYIKNNAGINVTVGVLEQECRQLIHRFITFHTQQRPFITLKWAESADGFIDLNRTGGHPYIFSSPLSSMLVHKRRAEHIGILVGRKTALLDNPSLTTRSWYGKNPLRMVIDKDLTLPEHLALFDGSTPTIVFTRRTDVPIKPQIEYIPLDFDKDILPQIMEVLYQKKKMKMEVNISLLVSW